MSCYHGQAAYIRKFASSAHNRLTEVAPELAKGEDMVEGPRNDILPVGPVPGNRNRNDLVEDSLEEEMVGMPSTEVTDQAPKGPITQVPGHPEEIPPAPVAQVPGQPAPATVR